MILQPSPQPLFTVAAIFICFVGCHSSLSLAAASIRLHRRGLTALTGLLFSLQSIFSLHFIAMCGIDLGVEWGFDIGLTIASISTVVVFGTLAVSGATWLRTQLEPEVDELLSNFKGKSSFAHCLRVFKLVLTHLPLWKPVTLVILMVVAAAGCHHLGMWSMRGLGDDLLMSQLTYWSFLWTVGIGGAVCVFIVLVFLIVPEGHAAWAAAFLMTGGISMFHFLSAHFGMVYVLGEPGIANSLPIGKEAIFIIVIFQGALSQIINSSFSKLAVLHYNEARQELALAHKLGHCIADMDLVTARAVHAAHGKDSALGKVLAAIVDNLDLYRPYLPDTLFAGAIIEESPRINQAGDVVLPQSRSVDSVSSISCGPEPMTRCRSKMSDCIGISPTYQSLPRHLNLSSLKGEQFMFSTGLRRSHIALLRCRLTLPTFDGVKILNQATIEDLLKRFMSSVTSEIKGHGGTIVSCAGGLAVGLWRTYSPDQAMECAQAIRDRGVPLTQAVQCFNFLIGNLAAQHFRSFNVVGPVDWLGQQLLSLNIDQDHNHIYITEHEKTAVSLRHSCLPVELVAQGQSNLTVYLVMPRTAQANDDEWMYRIAVTETLCPVAELHECWQAYAKGLYTDALAFLHELVGLPDWYVRYLQRLFGRASGLRLWAPCKNLNGLGWMDPTDDEALLSSLLPSQVS